MEREHRTSEGGSVSAVLSRGARIEPAYFTIDKDADSEQDGRRNEPDCHHEPIVLPETHDPSDQEFQHEHEHDEIRNDPPLSILGCWLHELPLRPRANMNTLVMAFT